MLEEETENKKCIKKSKPRKKIVKKTTNIENTDSDNESKIPETDSGIIEVQCISYQEKEYYLEPKSERVYILNLEDEESLVFVGMVEGKHINFDAESTFDTESTEN